MPAMIVANGLDEMDVGVSSETTWSTPTKQFAIVPSVISKLANKTVGLGEERITNLEFVFISWRIHHRCANRHQTVRPKIVWLRPAAEFCPMSSFERKSQIYGGTLKQHKGELSPATK